MQYKHKIKLYKRLEKVYISDIINIKNEVSWMSILADIKKTNLNKKKIKYILIFTVACILSFLYLFSAFRKGIWYKGYFLYQVKENEWSGTVFHETLHLIRTPSDHNIQLYATWGNESETYSVSYKESNNAPIPITIYKSEEPIFNGYYDSFHHLLNNDGNLFFELEVITHYSSPSANVDWQPSETLLARLALEDNTSFRGDLNMVLIVALLAIILLLDIKFPKLFFYLSHGLYVNSPEPSSFYTTAQMISRVIIGLSILLCVISTFF